MERTIEEWYSFLPEPYKSQALANRRPRCEGLKVDSLHEAINSGFSWSDTPEGDTQWNNLYYTTKNLHPIGEPLGKGSGPNIDVNRANTEGVPNHILYFLQYALAKGARPSLVRPRTLGGYPTLRLVVAQCRDSYNLSEKARNILGDTARALRHQLDAAYPTEREVADAMFGEQERN